MTEPRTKEGKALAGLAMEAMGGSFVGVSPDAIRERILAIEAEASPATGEGLDVERAVPAFAKRLLAEIPRCTGCDFDHSWDDHVLAIWNATTLDLHPEEEK